MTYLQMLEEGCGRLLEASIEEARQDATLLLLEVSGFSRADLFLEGQEQMPAEKEEDFRRLLARRVQHEPLQYLIGEQDFCGLPFSVRKGVLIPRPETELLEEAVFRSSEGKKVLDLCTGSGCIAITVARLGKPALVAASDLSADALKLAQENAAKNNAEVTFFCGDLFASVCGRYDIIVSNPPYIRSDVIATLMPEVREYEPRLALDGSEDGLVFYRRIVNEAPDYLEQNGRLMFEIGHDQGKAVAELMRQRGFEDIEVRKDYAGLDRMVFGVWSGK